MPGDRRPFDSRNLEDLRRASNIRGLRIGAVPAAMFVAVAVALHRGARVGQVTFGLIMASLVLVLAASIATVLTLTSHGRRWGSLYSCLFPGSLGGLIGAANYLDAGNRSTPDASLMLLVLGTGAIFLWSAGERCLCYGLIGLGYVAPAVASRIESGVWRETGVSGAAYLIASVTLAVSIQRQRTDPLRRELSAQRRFEQIQGSLETACNELRELDQRRSKFFNYITHELRIPLTMILAPLESLIEDTDSDLTGTHREYLQTMRANARRLLRLIDDLLDLSRIEANHLRLRVENTDLRKLLREIAQYATPLAARKHITLELDLDEPQGNVFVDLEKMERVFVNLVANALKFTEPDGRVVIWTRESGEVLDVGVQDTGSGIPIEVQPWIFERFRQASEAVTRRYGGTGLGLALAKEIVELHGGHISVSSQEGSGSNFVVRLLKGSGHFPQRALGLAAEPNSTPSRTATSDREPREWMQVLTESKDFRYLDLETATERRLAPRGRHQAHATKVLICEDNVELLRFLSLQLREEHAVYLAQDGRRGLELARLAQPDVIVTDYLMPHMDGLTLLTELKQSAQTADIPVIVLTASNGVADRLAARDAGADIYLHKPFSPQELRTAVALLLRKRGRQAAIVAHEQVKSLEVIGAGFAHEVRNPLAYISNAVHVLAEEFEALRQTAEQPEMTWEELRSRVTASRDKTQRMLRVATTGIERIRLIVELVRSYATRGQASELMPIELDGLVRDVACLILPPEGRQIEVVHQLTTAGVQVKCAPGELRQVIGNLLQNAFEAVAQAGRVCTRTRQQGASVLLEVLDDGSGIAPDLLNRVFTPFFTTKEPGKGMGLGLAISHQLVTQMGGEISVESVVNQGTVFRVRLPIYGASDSATREPRDFEG